MIDYAHWFDALVRASWQGGLLVAFVWILLRVSKRGTASSRSWIWPIVMAKFLLVTFLVWELPVFAPPETVAVPAQLFEAVQVLSSPQIPTETGWPIEQIVIALWLAGVAIIALRSACEYAFLRKLSRIATPSSSDVVNLCKPLTDRNVAVKDHPDVPVPFVFGVLKPVVLLPSALIHELTEEQLSMVLAHEFAHVQRRDTVTAIYVFVCQALFFFHPAVWLAKYEWQVARESACDQYSMEKTRTDRRTYGAMLIKISTGAQRAPAFALSAVPAFKTLHRRINDMKTTHKKSGAYRLVWLVLATLIAAAAMPFAFVHKQDTIGDTMLAQLAKKKKQDSKVGYVTKTKDGKLQYKVLDKTKPVIVKKMKDSAVGYVTKTKDGKLQYKKLDDKNLGYVTTTKDGKLQYKKLDDKNLGYVTTTKDGKLQYKKLGDKNLGYVTTTKDGKLQYKELSVKGLGLVTTQRDTKVGNVKAIANAKLAGAVLTKKKSLAKAKPVIGAKAKFATAVVLDPKRKGLTKITDAKLEYVKVKDGTAIGYAVATDQSKVEVKVIEVDGTTIWVAARPKAKINVTKDGTIQIVEVDGAKYWVSIKSKPVKAVGVKLEVKEVVVDGTKFWIVTTPRKKKSAGSKGG